MKNSDCDCPACEAAAKAKNLSITFFGLALVGTLGAFYLVSLWK